MGTARYNAGMAPTVLASAKSRAFYSSVSWNCVLKLRSGSFDRNEMQHYSLFSHPEQSSGTQPQKQSARLASGAQKNLRVIALLRYTRRRGRAGHRMLFCAGLHSSFGPLRNRILVVEAVRQSMVGPHQQYREKQRETSGKRECVFCKFVCM